MGSPDDLVGLGRLDVPAGKVFDKLFINQLGGKNAHYRHILGFTAGAV
jgi:hypothetical protein